MIKEQFEASEKNWEEYRSPKCISWSAILVGAFTGVGLSFLLNLFSIAIGLSIVTTSKEGMESLAIGGFLGLIISAISSMFVAGLVAGYLGRPYCHKRNLGVPYGFTTWCLALILTVLLATHMGQYISSYSKFITNPTAAIVTHEENRPAITQSTQESNSIDNMSIQSKNRDLGTKSLLMFVLFFIGAFSSCLGGHFGMTSDELFCKKNTDDLSSGKVKNY